MLEQFTEYVSNYDMDNYDIKYKYNHSIRVEKICEALASLLILNEEDTYIIKTIGLLHDIGRFEQLKLIGKYSDSEFDHAAYGAMILFKDGLIEKFNIDAKYYDIIEFAIRNHNRYQIEDIDDERKIFFAKLIRDADKLDILDAYTYLHAYSLADINEDVTNEVAIQFKKHESINKKIKKTQGDRLLLILSFIYDINFIESLKIISEQKYLDELYNQIKNNEKYKEYFECVKDYIQERIDTDAR